MDRYCPPFSITNSMLLLVSSIMEKIGKIDSFDSLSKLPVLRKQNRIKSIHSSCAIEANSLSLDEVTSVINGIEVTGPQKDIEEVRNAIEAYALIEKINPLKETDLKRIHGIFGNKVVSTPGQYRTGNEGVSDELGNVVFIAPPPRMVSSLMGDLFDWMKREYKNISPLILSSVFHYEFVFIHPFSDANGRTARYWQNALLGKWNPIFYWLPIENQIYKYQNKYYEAISESHKNGDSNEFILFMLSMIDKTLDDLIRETEEDKYSHSIYIGKLLKVLKKNVWYSSKEILEKLGIVSKETLRKNYLNPAIKMGIVILEFKDKPTSKNQRYKIVR